LVASSCLALINKIIDQATDGSKPTNLIPWDFKGAALGYC
jgi:hypothetical protein